MKLDKTAQKDLLLAFQNHTGHKGEEHLRNALNRLRFSVYVRSNDMGVLVNTQTLLREYQQKNIPPTNVIAMPFHNTAVQRLIKLYEIFGGYLDERKIIQAISNIDLTVYQQKTTGQHILVFSDDYVKTLNGTNLL